MRRSRCGLQVTLEIRIKLKIILKKIKTLLLMPVIGIVFEFGVNDGDFNLLTAQSKEC